jgi:excinuclease ABC subunit A
VTGASGTGKTSYFIHGLANYFHKEVYGTYYSDVDAVISFSGKKPKFEKVIVIDSILGKVTSRSTVGTNLGISPYVRKHFANLAISKSMGLTDGHFSSNTDQGKCLSCEGRGIKTFDMSFMEDIELPCDDCGGMKLKPIYANISDGKYTFHQISKLPLNDLIAHIGKTPKLRKLAQLLELLNLGHLSMDREVKSLSGGERQRLKLLGELQSDIGNSLLIFENISFGLSRTELLGINDLFHRLVAQNNTLIVIDQNTIFELWTDKIIKF